jgi:hypothetical protein
MVRRYAGPAIVALFGVGLQVSGIQNPVLAVVIWGVAIVWAMYAWGWPQVSSRFRRETGSGLSHTVIPGPISPTLPQVAFATEARRHYAHVLGYQPKAIRFSKPDDRTVRADDLPVFVQCGRGRLVVEKFYALGVVIDEDRTSGDAVAFTAY